MSDPLSLFAKTKGFVKRHVEVILLLLFFFACWGFLYTTIGGPTTWDELLYMDLGLNPRADGHYLNRWAHIYFQKLFLDVAPTPLQGARLFWGFLVSATLVFTYLIAKSITSKSNYLNGITAVLFLGSSALIFKFAGNTYADYTVMFFVTLAVWVYLFYSRSRSRYRWLLLVLFGFVFFAAVKSKETGIVLLIPILGFGFKDNAFNIRFFVKNLAFIVGGMVVSLGLLTSLDNLFVGDPLVSISAQSLSEYSSFVLRNSSLESAIKERIYAIVVTFSAYWLDIIKPWIEQILWRLPVFSLLYLVTLFYLVADLSKVRKQRNRDWAELFIWLLPVAFLIILVLAASGAKDRHFFPMHPILAILGAQFFTIALPINMNQISSRFLRFIRLRRTIVSIFLMGIYLLYRYGTEINLIYDRLLVTFSGIIMILLSVWARKWTTMLSALALLSVITFSFYGIFFENFIPLAKGEIAAESIERFRPLEDITGVFQCAPTTRIYVSSNVHRDFDTLGRDLSSNPWFFNVFFDCQLSVSQFTFAWPPTLPADITEGEIFTYAFLTTTEFNELGSEGQQEIEEIYLVRNIYNGQIIFLSSE